MLGADYFAFFLNCYCVYDISNVIENLFSIRALGRSPSAGAREKKLGARALARLPAKMKYPRIFLALKKQIFVPKSIDFKIVWCNLKIFVKTSVILCR